MKAIRRDVMSKQINKLFALPENTFSNLQEGKDRILRIAEVRGIVGICTASIYSYMKKGEFPNQIKIGPRMVGWLESEIQEWIASQVTATRDKKTG